MKQTRQTQSAFTLIELMISIFVLMMISTIMVANFRMSEREKRLVIAKDLLLNAIRTAQNLTLSSKQIPGSVCAPGGVPNKAAVNYRIYYTETNSNFSLRAEDKCGVVNTIETYILPSDITFKAGGSTLTTSTSTTSYPSIILRFNSPFAQPDAASTHTSPTFFDYQTATIRVVQGSTGAEKIISVDGISGRIE